MNQRIDTQKLSLHPKEVSNWLDNDIIPPIYIEITPTNTCNHKCIFCAVDYCRGTRFLDTDIMARFLLDSFYLGIRSCMIAGEGEPFMHNRLDAIIQPTLDKIDYAIATNGVLANPQRIARILPLLKGLRFSMDSGTPENYQIIHGTKRKNDFWQVLSHVTESTKIKKETKSQCDIAVQFLAIDENIDTLESFLKIYTAIPVDLISIKPYTPASKCLNNLTETYDPQFRYKLNEITSKFSDKRIKVRNESFERAETELSYRICYALSFWGHITGDGNCYACGNFLHDDRFYIGNIYQETAEQIWLGDKRKRVIELGKQGFSDCRQNCRLEDCNNWLSELLKQRQDKWYNFI